MNLTQAKNGLRALRALGRVDSGRVPDKVIDGLIRDMRAKYPAQAREIDRFCGVDEEPDDSTDQERMNEEANGYTP